MSQRVELNGIILSEHPYGDNDKRLVILTKERGKITVFAKGARRPTSPLLAGSRQFSFGSFDLFEGRSSFNLMTAHIQRYFEELSLDLTAACYGCYFCEIAEYYTREANDEIEMLKLVYVSLRALTAKSLTKELVRFIYELRVMVINGICPVDFDTMGLMEATVYTLNYIANAPIEKLFTFSVTDAVMDELRMVMNKYRQLYLEGHFKSLEILETLM